MKSKSILAITKQLMYIRENAETLAMYANRQISSANEKKDLIICEVNEIFALLESEVKDD